MNTTAHTQGRTITKADRLAAARLNAIYQAKRKELGLTQAILADRRGCAQGAISQYLTGKIALNTDAVLFFATQLDVEPTEIRQDLFKKHKRGLVPTVAVRVRYLLKDSAVPVEGKTVDIDTVPVTDGAYAVEIKTNNYSPTYEDGTVLVIDPTVEPAVNDAVILITVSGEHLIGRVFEINEEQVSVDLLNAPSSTTIKRAELTTCDLIIGVQEPKRERAKRPV